MDPVPDASHRRSDRVAAAAAGVVATLAGVGTGELVAGLIAPVAAPISAVGGTLIDLAPKWAKDTAIAWFGTGDKVALVTGIVLVLVAVSAVAGLLEWRRAPVGRMLIGAVGVLGAVAAATRAPVAPTNAVPSLAAAAVAVAVLALLRVRAPRPVASDGGASRRVFLIWASAAAAIGVLATVGGAALRGGAAKVAQLVSTLRLPKPATAFGPIPAGAELDIAGLAPVVTPNATFYRIDTALQVPLIDPADWRLRIHGMVDRELTLTWEELLALPLEESATTLMCVSNPVGGDLTGNAIWLGTPIRDLLTRAGVQPGADMVLSRSHDGWTASTPLEALTDVRNAILAVGMNGTPLPIEHGFPVRMVVPGLYGYVSATKWLVDLEVTRFDRARAYWTDRGWSERGPIKLSSRIDVPRPGTSIPTGEVVVAGVAWFQHIGVAAVEVQIDEGPWHQAELATAMSIDTWVQWRYRWQAAPGRHTIRVRSTGADGRPQETRLADVAPDGATGLHTINIEVT
ncbi:MAG TPA: molybdopterin-dependent oxidoreductase [Candidatus Lumbricidophila sp.]|nr:molybdopterin-dependent oxidoreductase [Candidatus Lumbricidophila sp.]